MEAVRAAGDPVTLAELAAERIAPEKNADTYLRRAEKDLEAVDRELADVYNSDSFRDRRSDPEQLATTERVLEAYPAVVPLLAQAAEAEAYHLDLDYALAPSAFLEAYMSRVSRLRSAARLLRARSILRSARGDREGALRDGMLALRLSQKQDPLLIGYLVSVAVRGMAVADCNRVLQSGPVSDELRGELEGLLSRLDVTEAFRAALRSERAFGISSFRETVPGRNNWLIRAYWDRQEVQYLELLRQEMKLTEQPFPEVWQHRLQTKPDAWGTLVKLFFPAAEKARQAAERDRASVACLRVVNALARRDKPDQPPPADLADLGLPDEATRDPFSGERLKVKPAAGGWLVYSVGLDLQDDGGVEEKDVALAPPAE
jgi:hypothetical protein